MTDAGSLSIADNSPSHPVRGRWQTHLPTEDGGTFFCLGNQFVEADLTLTASCCDPTQVNQGWVAKRVAVKSSHQTELEGVIVGINSDTQWLGGFVLQKHSLLPPWLAWLTTPAAMLPHPFRHHLPDLRKHGCHWKRGFRPASRVGLR